MGDFRFSLSIPVRYSDLDAQGHLNHARYLSFMEEARFRYIVAVGLWDPAQGFDAVGQVVAEATCAYKRPVFINQTVDVAVRISRVGHKSLEMIYQMSVGADVVALGRTVQVAYDYAAQLSILVPQEWRDKISAFEGEVR